MSRMLKRRLALGVAILALMSGGAIAAVSATGRDATSIPAAAHWRARHRSEQLLGTAASYLDLSPDQLRSKLESGETLAQLAEATSGKSEEGLIEALIAGRKSKLEGTEARLYGRVRTAISRPLPGTRAAHRDAGEGAHTAVLSYLGISASQLHGELRSGKTLGQIAQATQGKSEVGLIEAIVAAKSRRLQAAVSAGRLRGAQESTALARMRGRVKRMVDHLHMKKKAA